MKRRIAIEPVPPRKWLAAIRFLVGGNVRDPIQEARADVLRRLVHQRGEENVRLWWARKGRTCAGSAMVIENPGRTGMLFHTSVGAEGADAESLVRVVRAICRDALHGGLSMVQVLLDPDAGGDVEMLETAGMVRLARLVYLELDLGKAPPFEADPSLTWRSYGQFADPELCELIRRTYEGSLDCPPLAGVREVEDVLVGHKTSGTFRPRAWWIAERNGDPAGCILVNDSLSGRTAEIVYVGTAPEHRGHGIGRTMIRRAAAEGRQRGLETMTLAVDADNYHAVRLYKAEGYGRKDIRLAYVMRRRDVTGGEVGAL